MEELKVRSPTILPRRDGSAALAGPNAPQRAR
jgi:hypothetical protein